MSHEVEHRIPLRIDVVSRSASEREVTGEGPDGEAGEGERFEFTAEASNNSLDYYCTHMTEGTLANFARDAEAAVQFLDSHKASNLGYGRTFGGRVERIAGRRPDWSTYRREGVELAVAPPADYVRALIDVFTIPGIRFGGGLTYASTDDFIRAVRAGLARDVSVGFSGGDWRCDICGGDYRSYRDCEHFAGAVYPAGEQGERRVLATVTIDGAHLHELSAVYDGATPDAMLRKAERAARAGEIEPATKRLLEARYRVELPTQTISAGVDVSKRGRAAASEVNVDFEQLYEDARAAIAETLDRQMEPAEAIRYLAGELTQALEAHRATEADVLRLTPLADEGRAYRADLVAQALAEGVRAFGEEFAEETYRGVLESAELSTVKRMRDDWARIAVSRFAGGRQTVDEEETPVAPQRRVVPDDAYAA